MIAFHKPYGVLCQFTSSKSDEGPTLAKFIDVPGVYPIGRLDKDSEGLVLLTTDGGLQNRLTDPKHKHPRTYWAQVERVPDEQSIRRLSAGVDIEDYRTRPAKIRLLEAEPELPPRVPPIRFRKTVPTAWLELILTEGRNRQVRKMTAAIGHPTLRLIRVASGAVGLEGLAPGTWRELAPREIRGLQKSLVDD